ncbi:MAG: 3-phosphoglycerate dehydrogenase family protein [Oscillospiraceae bacterium]|nr:3-phosphoglycerate dehydrogenase family protein [Oscillospiraceae bacterium]
MYTILTRNKISSAGLAALEGYTITDLHTNPDGVIVRSGSMHEDAFGDALAAIARAGAGVNNIPIERCSKAGIAVFNTPGANANAVKELVICGLFMAARKIGAGMRWADTLKGQGKEVGKLVEKGKGAFGGDEIAGKTLGVIGLGAIGAMTASAAAALGMHVIGYDPYISLQSALALDNRVQFTDEINELYAASDYISLHSPLNDGTRGMINATTLGICKDGVRILNFARAELVDNNSIIDALATGKVLAYVTDFPTDEQLGVDGVTAMPHLGASTAQSEENCAIMASKQLKDYLEQGIVKNSINLPEIKIPLKSSPRVCIIHDVCEALRTQISTAVGTSGAAVTRMFSAENGIIAYTVYDVTEKIDIRAIRGIPGVKKVRMI